ncbi:hypothetical protein N7474_003665 [Penicillium riverlandense]|uniref:uncharacterized protein n=1 Tax=Penicillium riverlandense TaxID=1903569 RepID=UPI0025494C56|nr:uncharacterized protein N7474_003665 [Penicillium riverlandense]KAJ5818074.1 hypothetical protein N7474_003665 [Penicillium riverlandense]
MAATYDLKVPLQKEDFTSIPILDFAQVSSPSTKSAFLENLRDALINVGFFYLRNAPISPDLQSLFTAKGLELFQLPLERKLEIEMVNSPHFLGYSKLGAEITALKQDYREQFDAKALDLPSNALDDVFDNPQQHKLKLIKYPPPPASENDDSGFQGVGPHKDSGFLTFLLQATPHHGLEVQNKAGTWIPAPPLPNTLVVNIGRALEALTGGICSATTHRVSLRQEHFLDAEGKSLGSRFSFPVFQGVSLDLSAGKISLVIPEHIRDLVKDDKVKSDAEATFNEMFRGSIGEGTFVARVTSHQDVGQRWYPDVLAKALKGQKDFVSR